ncbi:hypothetical protein DL96DRAFT_1559595 [Flagelloscypha sp. PMI_526]|nr:hypothetical protein DL96DRAFT_1559595 [Flagelloscypha sp. PMI_526]
MFARVAALFLFVALAGRVLAQTAAPANSSFILTVGKVNITTAQILAINPVPSALTSCKAPCDEASGKFSSCGNDASCICANTTADSLQKCEQCMFTFQIQNNLPNTDFRIGSTPVLGALGASCAAANMTVNKTLLALALPPTWDGPTGIVLGTPLTVVGVITAFTLAMGAIITLSSL